MTSFSRLRWFLGRLVSPVRAVVPGSSSSTSSSDVAQAPVEERPEDPQGSDGPHDPDN